MTPDLYIPYFRDLGRLPLDHMVSFATPQAIDQPGQPPMVRSIQGQVYRFDLVRVDGGWRISRIETIPVWKSGHLDRSP